MNATSALIEAARSYLDVPFVHCGRSRTGVDCVGLLCAAMRDVGLADYAPKPYARGDHSRLCAEVEQFAEAVEGEPIPGDLLVMRVRGEVTHLALVTGEGTIIHANEKVGRVVEQRLGIELMGRVYAVYRWRSGK